MQGTFCRKLLRLPPNTGNCTAEYELSGESRRGEDVFENSRILV
jgi:hypothetical protein